MEPPIFIVGAQRSGTTLLSAMIAAHAQISCGPETHFFRKLTNVDPQGLCNPKSWPEAAVNFICSISHTDYTGNQKTLLIDKYRLSRDEIYQYLNRRAPSIPNILSSVTEQFMMCVGKSRWAEKTPDHISHVRTIRRYFPDSPIIHIIRDPRDVALSLEKLPWGTKSFLEGLIYWEGLLAATESFFFTDTLAYTLRYEDLILSPEEELSKLCHIIGMEYEPGMLDTSNTGKRINTRNVTWKEKASQPLDPSRVNAWKRELPIAKKLLAEAFIGDRLKDYHYPVESSFDHYGEIYPVRSEAPVYEPELESIVAQRVRFWKHDTNEKIDTVVLLGNPGRRSWLGEGKLVRLRRTMTIMFKIIHWRRSRNCIIWLTEKSSSGGGGFLAHLLHFFLRPYRYPETPIAE